MMTTDGVNYLTRKGFDELEERLSYLRTVRRQEIAERLHRALEEGGELAENAEYEDAKNDQAFLEGEITRLETILSNAQIIEERRQKDKVALGDHVTVQERGSTITEVYHLVGAAEANPKEGKISHKSPLGQALMGKKVGDRVKVNAPDGTIMFEIVAID